MLPLLDSGLFRSLPLSCEEFRLGLELSECEWRRGARSLVVCRPGSNELRGWFSGFSEATSELGECIGLSVRSMKLPIGGDFGS